MSLAPDDETDSALVSALVTARRDAARAVLPDGWRVDDLPSAYRLQHAVASRLGAVRGWKVSALTAEQQRAMQVPGPVAAPLLDPWFHRSGVALTLASFCQTPLLECEFAFALGKDLPARTTPYSRAEVEAAISAMHPALEVCDSRIGSAASTLQQLADGFNNGAFVLGAACADWRSIDYAAHALALCRGADGERLESGSGRAILNGDPIGAVVAMANLQPSPLGGLRAGHVITTGSCIRPLPVTADGEFVGDFGTLGQVRVRFGGPSTPSAEQRS